MFNSLRVRLLLTMSVVALVAVGSIALLTSRSTTDQFQRYVATDIQRNQQLVSDLMPQAIIDQLKVVQVEKQHSDRS